MCRLLDFFNVILLSFQLIHVLSRDSSEEKSGGNSEKDADNGFYFVLYTRKNPNPGYTILNPGTVSSLSGTSFDARKVTKICIHGFHGSAEDFVEETGLKESYLAVYDANVFIMDWSACAQHNYLISVGCISKAGDELRKLLDTLKRLNTSPWNVHIIGFSLGAHIAGDGCVKTNDFNISRITALDAAAPFLEHPKLSSQRILTKWDARFVDAIHTDVSPIGYGTSHTFTVDFYPNGGKPSQPGCDFISDYTKQCSHRRSYIYFKESIISAVGFYAIQCGSYDDFQNERCDGPLILMGEFVDKKQRGKYYLETNSKAPYARGTNIHRKNNE